ncbi:MAG: hypothetical protein ACYCZN_01810 [Candidatus Dormibacteria bacterium]
MELNAPWQLGLASELEPRRLLTNPVRPELKVAELLRASAAWAAIHPEDVVEALTVIFNRTGIPRRDRRFDACQKAVAAALGGEYRNLAEVCVAEGPGAVSAAFLRASLAAAKQAVQGRAAR